MKKYISLRLSEKDARKIFRDDEGKRVGDDQDVRVVRMAMDDPRYGDLASFEKKWYDRGSSFAFYTGVLHEYSKEEMNAAELLQFTVAGRIFEPSGEEVGTLYDDASACPVCGSGAPQTTPLRLKLSTIPKKQDFAMSIGHEIVVSLRAVEILRKNRVTGLIYGPVYGGKTSTEPSPDWHQLIVKNADADIVAPTWIGTLPYDWDTNEYRCPRGDNAGFKALSELTVQRAGTRHPDAFQTRQFLADRRGLLRPYRPILVSQKFHRVVLEHGLKGAFFDVAHFA
jgi:hypothetical protein